MHATSYSIRFAIEMSAHEMQEALWSIQYLWMDNENLAFILMAITNFVKLSALIGIAMIAHWQKICENCKLLFGYPINRYFCILPLIRAALRLQKQKNDPTNVCCALKSVHAERKTFVSMTNRSSSKMQTQTYSAWSLSIAKISHMIRNGIGMAFWPGLTMLFQ